MCVAIAARVCMEAGELVPTTQELNFVRKMWQSYCNPALKKYINTTLREHYKPRPQHRIPDNQKKKKGRKRKLELLIGDEDGAQEEDEEGDQGGAGQEQEQEQEQQEQHAGMGSHN